VEHTLRDAIGSLDDSSEAKSAVSFVIEVVSGPESGKRLEITAGRALIGTSPVCDLVLTDERVSRRHLALSLEGAHLRVEDLASTNGTFTNELRITGAYLDGGEKITLG
jgi:pSer/pThr/pTyr-binding forkhead associated (FHA) protein